MKPFAREFFFLIPLIICVFYVDVADAVVRPCQYCRYCQFCSHCESCPCKPAPGNFCDHYKYCQYCPLCKVCDTACNEDTLLGGLFSKFGSLLDSLGFTAKDIEEAETPDVDSLDEALRQKFGSEEHRRRQDDGERKDL